MRCAAYSQVSSYNLPPLALALGTEGSIQSYDDVLHLSLEVGDAFFFEYGVAVFWNLPDAQNRDLLEQARPSSTRDLGVTEEDEFAFSYGSGTRCTRNEIILPNEDPMTKLAASHAIAQSVKLGIFEQTVAKMIEKTESIPHELSRTGRQPLSSKKLRQMMGQLHLERASINLRFDLLDEPEFFWDYEELEPVYETISHYLDIEDRVAVLNQRMEVVRELFEMLSDELKHQHSSRLEWTIIWLIVIEVIITLGKDVFHWI